MHDDSSRIWIIQQSPAVRDGGEVKREKSTENLMFLLIY
jgi:hypothetical protein